jgi:hypothetical protein
MEAVNAAKRAKRKRVGGKANAATNGLALTDAARHAASAAGTCDAADLMESAMNWGLTVAECNTTFRDPRGGGNSLDYCDPSIRRVDGGGSTTAISGGTAKGHGRRCSPKTAVSTPLHAPRSVSPNSFSRSLENDIEDTDSLEPLLVQRVVLQSTARRLPISVNDPPS